MSQPNGISSPNIISNKKCCMKAIRHVLVGARYYCLKCADDIADFRDRNPDMFKAASTPSDVLQLAFKF